MRTNHRLSSKYEFIFIWKMDASRHFWGFLRWPKTFKISFLRKRLESRNLVFNLLTSKTKTYQIYPVEKDCRISPTLDSLEQLNSKRAQYMLYCTNRKQRWEMNKIYLPLPEGLFHFHFIIIPKLMIRVLF